MDRTLAIMKPDCVQKKLEGKVVDKILENGFNILGLKMIRLSEAQAKAFYDVHEGKPFYDELVDFMTEGPVVVASLEKENAVAVWRELMGATNPAEAAEGTLRKLYADNVGRNIVHGSDAAETAKRETSFFFSEIELI
jgi:nucleoside-diphosphate kinase